MERVKIEASLREKTGKGVAKKLRREKIIPAVLYGKETNAAISIPLASMKALRAINFSSSTIIDMLLGSDKNNINVLIKDVQYHPLTEDIIHIDFLKVSLEEKLKVKVGIVLKGEAKGIKDGGIVEQILWELDIEGLPLEIPEKIEVDITNLGIGDSIHAGNISLTGNLKVITAAQETVVTVVSPQLEEEAPAAGTVAPEGPEIIKEKKDKPEEAAAQDDKAKDEKKEEPKKEEKKDDKKGKK